MIIGSGLLANAFSHRFLQHRDLCIFAAGVSNSSCVDQVEFARERQRLENSILQMRCAEVFVYFGTCSVADPEVQMSPYVRHKLEMEKLVRNHARNLILRLPQVAGKTPNPHTLLNFLCAHISRGESFNLWRNAKRNIIDIGDVVSIAEQFIADSSIRNKTINIANVVNYSMLEIVAAMERVIDRNAVYDVIERGAEYFIDTSGILPLLDKANVKFDNDYLENLIKKYYSY